MIVDGGDRIKYSLFRSPGDAVAGDLGAQIKASLDLLRGRLDAVPDHAVAVIARQDPAKPGRSTALIQRFLDRPAFVGAVAVGAETDLAAGNAQAPIVFSVRYIDGALLKEIGGRLQLTHLREIDDRAPPAGDHAIEFADAHGGAIARFAWQPTRPGGTIAGSVLPFIAVALAGFALLIGFGLRYMRRTAEEIRAGESQLRHLALHDPVCGLPNRIYFGERLETVINDVRAGGATAAVFYIDLDHFKDVNDTLGHHIGDELILNVTQRLSRIMRGEDLVARLGGDEFANPGPLCPRLLSQRRQRRRGGHRPSLGGSPCARSRLGRLRSVERLLPDRRPCPRRHRARFARRRGGARHAPWGGRRDFGRCHKGRSVMPPATRRRMI